MNSDYLRDLQAWVHYVNGWMSFWNMVDLTCFGAVFIWLVYLTIVIGKAKRERSE